MRKKISKMPAKSKNIGRSALFVCAAIVGSRGASIFPAGVVVHEDHIGCSSPTSDIEIESSEEEDIKENSSEKTKRVEVEADAVKSKGPLLSGGSSCSHPTRDDTRFRHSPTSSDVEAAAVGAMASSIPSEQQDKDARALEKRMTQLTLNPNPTQEGELQRKFDRECRKRKKLEETLRSQGEQIDRVHKNGLAGLCISIILLMVQLVSNQVPPRPPVAPRASGNAGATSDTVGEQYHAGGWGILRTFQDPSAIAKTCAKEACKLTQWPFLCASFEVGVDEGQASRCKHALVPGVCEGLQQHSGAEVPGLAVVGIPCVFPLPPKFGENATHIWRFEHNEEFSGDRSASSSHSSNTKMKGRRLHQPTSSTGKGPVVWRKRMFQENQTCEIEAIVIAIGPQCRLPDRDESEDQDGYNWARLWNTFYENHKDLVGRQFKKFVKDAGFRYLKNRYQGNPETFRDCVVNALDNQAADMLGCLLPEGWPRLTGWQMREFRQVYLPQIQRWVRETLQDPGVTELRFEQIRELANLMLENVR
ncbi:unnamed protein product [Amoebophrya sp. A25]|nr:unnamed protein product [Amoebophrya sp. A25]|eukprot:GSA25T00011595001.1